MMMYVSPKGRAYGALMYARYYREQGNRVAAAYWLGMAAHYRRFA